MNFQELLQKMSALDRPISEDAVAECGMMGDMGGSISAPKQQDSVTMNVSMNGSGSGGIRDLLNVLKDIQNGPDEDPDMEIDSDGDSEVELGHDVLMQKDSDDEGDGESELDLEIDEFDFPEEIEDDGFENSEFDGPGPEVSPIGTVTKSGSDLHRSKSSFPKASGGDNPMRLENGATYKMPAGDIQIKLENLYREISNRPVRR